MRHAKCNSSSVNTLNKVPFRKSGIKVLNSEERELSREEIDLFRLNITYNKDPVLRIPIHIYNPMSDVSEVEKTLALSDRSVEYQ